jgi:hypothetical protein
MPFRRGIAASAIYCSLAASAMDLRNGVVFLPSGAALMCRFSRSSARS